MGGWKERATSLDYSIPVATSNVLSTLNVMVFIYLCLRNKWCSWTPRMKNCEYNLWQRICSNNAFDGRMVALWNHKSRVRWSPYISVETQNFHSGPMQQWWYHNPGNPVQLEMPSSLQVFLIRHWEYKRGLVVTDCKKRIVIMVNSLDIFRYSCSGKKGKLNASSVATDSP